MKSIPAQPGEERWKFVEDLKSPMWTHHNWGKTAPGDHLADLSGGVTLKKDFPDPKERLVKAYEDLRSFLYAGDVSDESGNYIIETSEDRKMKGESFRLEIQSGSCRIKSGSADGIRRGIFYLEDEMLRQRGPFLTPGNIEVKPVIERRISRCFFGPIKRAPRMRDELMDTVNYYPDQYLNRLVHEGVNGLWLTVELRDLVATSFTPDEGKNAPFRLAKLNRTVEACLRYGIRTYIFCIEPRAWETGSPVLKKYPELSGAPAYKGYYFCPMSKTAYRYLYESINKIFKAVPELGGIINITHGERETTCLSAVGCTSDYKGKIKCPRCSDKKPWEILNATLSPMEKGMHDAAPEAELISWLYMPQPQRFMTGDSFSLADWVYELPVHTPEKVILQFNFESGVSRTEFGKLLVGGDYWISNPGPSDRFVNIAKAARDHRIKVSAKIQTGNSHEAATLPFVPVPSLLYRKFKAMRELGVSHTMLCWYFGNYPGLMNKAAGLLSMEPFPENEDLFLDQLASIYWKKEDISKVTEAWKLFSEGYQNYPLVNLFQYYGPMHDGPVWPLLLKPADAPLSPTWQIGSSSTLKPWPPSGDRIKECTGDVLTLEEVVELTGRMTSSWEKGLILLNGIKDNYTGEPERLLDIGVAQALGIQLRSGYNILNFYLLREKMFRMPGRERLTILNQLEKIIREETTLDKQLLALCEKDSRLGFHSEAEGYKYFPEKIKWRMEQLNYVLKNDLPEIRKVILRDQLLFPDYTGQKPQGPVAECIQTEDSFSDANPVSLPVNLKWQPLGDDSKAVNLHWASACSQDYLFIVVSETSSDDTTSGINHIEGIEVKIEPERLLPARHFVFDSRRPDYDSIPVHIPGYDLIYKAGIRNFQAGGSRYSVVRIPFSEIGLNSLPRHPVRMNLSVEGADGQALRWRPEHPTTERLILGSDNPADLAWLVFKE